jgi:hypothetical protein
MTFPVIWESELIDSGTRLNADLSSSLILTVFDHGTRCMMGPCDPGRRSSPQAAICR